MTARTKRIAIIIITVNIYAMMMMMIIALISVITFFGLGRTYNNSENHKVIITMVIGQLNDGLAPLSPVADIGLGQGHLRLFVASINPYPTAHTHRNFW